MSGSNDRILEDNQYCRYALSQNGEVLISRWKHVSGLSAEKFRAGIIGFAIQCEKNRPLHAVIDAAALDQGSPAFAWLRGQDGDVEKEDYNTWWAREVLPVFHAAGIVSLALGTGDPSAPGELAKGPPGVNFKMGYFPDVGAAEKWSVGVLK